MEVNRSLAKEVAANQLSDARHAAAVIAQINNESICVSEELHRGDCSLGAKFGIDETIQLHIADVSVQTLDFFKSEIYRTCHASELVAVFGAQFFLICAYRYWVVAET